MGTRRITADVGTIPNNTTVSGAVTTSSVDSTVLEYTGPTDLRPIFGGGKAGVIASNVWIYVPSGTRKIARVTGLYWVNEATFDPDSPSFQFAIQLDRGIAGASSAAFSSVPSPVAFSYVNDGGSDITVGDGETQDTIKNGEGDTYSPYDPYSSKILTHQVLYVDASSSDVLIHEEI